MKKQLLTGVMALSLLVGSTAGAMAGEMPKDVTKGLPMTLIAMSDKADGGMKAPEMQPLTAESCAKMMADFKADSAKMLADGMTQAEIDQAWAGLESLLADVKAGKVVLSTPAVALTAATMVKEGDALPSNEKDAIPATATLSAIVSAKDANGDKTVKYDVINLIKDGTVENQDTSAKSVAATVMTAALVPADGDKINVFPFDLSNGIALTVENCTKQITDFKAANAKMLADGKTQAQIDQTLASMEQVLADLKAGKIGVTTLIITPETAGSEQDGTVKKLPLTKIVLGEETAK